MRKWIISSLLLLTSLCSIADTLPVAKISEDSVQTILSHWDETLADFQAENASYAVADPRRGMLLAVYLDAAFKESGYSLDKTFQLWYRKINNGPEIAQFPELHEFASSLGFVDLMSYLVVMKQPEYRAAMIDTGVFSRETIRITAPKPAAAEQLPDDTIDYGNVKADSYGCEEDGNEDDC